MERLLAPRPSPAQVKDALALQIADPAQGVGTVLACFDAVVLAQALEREIYKARARGQSHVLLNMTLDDAAALARFLQRGSLRRA